MSIQKLEIKNGHLFLDDHKLSSVIDYSIKKLDESHATLKVECVVNIMDCDYQEHLKLLQKQH